MFNKKNDIKNSKKVFLRETNHKNQENNKEQKQMSFVEKGLSTLNNEDLNIILSKDDNVDVKTSGLSNLTSEETNLDIFANRKLIQGASVL